MVRETLSRPGLESGAPPDSPGQIVHAGFVLTGDVEEEGVNGSRLRVRVGGLVTVHQGEAGGGEHAQLGVDLFAEVLGTDDGVIAAQVFDLPFQEGSIGGDFPGHLVGGDHPQAAEAVGPFEAAGAAHFTGEQRVRGPRGAPEDTGGIVGGSHGGEAFVE